MREFPSKEPFYFLMEIKVFCSSSSLEEEGEQVRGGGDRYGYQVAE